MKRISAKQKRYRSLRAIYHRKKAGNCFIRLSWVKAQGSFELCEWIEVVRE